MHSVLAICWVMLQVSPVPIAIGLGCLCAQLDQHSRQTLEQDPEGVVRCRDGAGSCIQSTEVRVEGDQGIPDALVFVDLGCEVTV